MKTKLKTVPDYLTQHTEGLVRDLKRSFDAAGIMGPFLSYIDPCGHEFSLPLTYEQMVSLGREMSDFRVCAHHMSKMGSLFGFYAVQAAARADNPENAAKDQEHFLFTMGHMLHQVSPVAFFVAIPTVVVVGAMTPESIAEIAAAGPDHPNAKNALVVVGRNPARGYAVVTPFKLDADQGLVTYEKPYTIDSSRGEHIGCLGPFSSIYDPSKN